MVREKIEIVTEMIDKFSNKARKITQVTQDMGNGVQQTTKTVQDFSKGQVVSERTTNQTTRGLRKFNFAWLSVMFAGMALNRVFGSLIKSQLQLFGITDLFAGVLTVVMLPIMELLLPLFLKLADIFLNLPDGIKLALGVFIVLGTILGIILTVVGQVALAVGGFILLWPTLGTIVAAVTGAIAGSLGVILIVIALIIAVVAGMVIAWRNDFLGMKAVVQNFIDGFKQTFRGAIQIVTGIFKIIKAIFTGDFDLLLEGLKILFEGFWNFLVGGFKIISSVILSVLIGALQIVWNLLKLIVESIKFVVRGAGKILGIGSSNSIPSRQSGGIIPNTGPFMLHKGERVLPAHNSNQGGESRVTINQTNNINVSDRLEMEKLIEENNTKLVEDVKRQIAT